MRIKICGLKYINNIKEVVKLKPDYIGFILYSGSKRYIVEQLQLAIYLKSVKEIKKVGVFVNANIDEIIEKIQTYYLDIVQLHGNETEAFCREINNYIPVIKAFQINEAFDFNSLIAYETACTYFLFDTASIGYGGSGQSFDWQLLNKYTLSKDYFLSGGIRLQSIERIKQLNDSRLIGIDINSLFETEPGLKDILKIKSLLHEIRN